MSEPTPNFPLGYFITFRTYGTWLPGDPRGSVDHRHNQPNTPPLPWLPARHARSDAARKQAVVTLDSAQRAVTDATLKEVCAYKGWTLHTKNVRTNHVHIVLSAQAPPEPVMNTLKSWCTRRMRERGVIPPGIEPWARHGSTRYLWTSEHIRKACEYVDDMQGPDLPMADLDLDDESGTDMVGR